MKKKKKNTTKKQFFPWELESIGFIYVYFNPPNSPEEQILHLHFINEDVQRIFITIPKGLKESDTTQ